MTATHPDASSDLMSCSQVENRTPVKHADCAYGSSRRCDSRIKIEHSPLTRAPNRGHAIVHFAGVDHDDIAAGSVSGGDGAGCAVVGAVRADRAVLSEAGQRRPPIGSGDAADLQSRAELVRPAGLLLERGSFPPCWNVSPTSTVRTIWRAGPGRWSEPKAMTGVAIVIPMLNEAGGTAAAIPLSPRSNLRRRRCWRWM